MIPHFTLRSGKQEHLIIRTGDAFHLIEVNEALTGEKRSAVLERSCTPAEMQQMGLSGMTIPKSDIQALTVTGCGHRDDVIFYLKKDTLAFQFPQAYEQRKVDDFFRGIPRKQVKSRKRFRRNWREDWRSERQTEPMRRIMGIVATIAQGYTAAATVGVLMTRRNPLILTLAFAALAVDLVLYLAFPAYFTLMGEKEYKSYGYRAKVRQLGFPMILCFAMLALTGMNRYYVFFERSEIYMVATVCVLLGLVLAVFSRECREQAQYLLLAVVSAAVFTGPCLAHLNYLTDFDRPEESAYYEVVQTKKVNGSRGGDRYYCIAALEDGEEAKLPISRAVYEQVDVGDQVPVIVSEGGLGLRYAYFDRDTYNKE